MASQFKKDAIAQVVLAFGPILLPLGVLLLLLTGMIIGRMADPTSMQCIFGVVAVWSGFVLLVGAKWPQLKSLRFMTFGVPGLPRENQRFYKLSYVIMLTGLILIGSSGPILNSAICFR